MDCEPLAAVGDIGHAHVVQPFGSCCDSGRLPAYHLFPRMAMVVFIGLFPALAGRFAGRHHCTCPQSVTSSVRFLHRSQHGLHHGVLHLRGHGLVCLHALLDGVAPFCGLPWHGSVCDDMCTLEE